MIGEQPEGPRNFEVEVDEPSFQDGLAGDVGGDGCSAARIPAMIRHGSSVQCESWGAVSTVQTSRETSLQMERPMVNNHLLSGLNGWPFSEAATLS